jgi:hypothetical protein
MNSDEIGGAAGAETSGIGAAAAPGRPLRMSAGRKRDAVLRILRGEARRPPPPWFSLTQAKRSPTPAQAKGERQPPRDRREDRRARQASACHRRGASA